MVEFICKAVNLDFSLYSYFNESEDDDEFKRTKCICIPYPFVSVEGVDVSPLVVENDSKIL